MKLATVPMYMLLVSALLLLPRASAVPAVTTAYSANWSGYVATDPYPYTSVSASWTVPSVSATFPPVYSAVWVGIGGVDRNSNRLLQAGTEQDVLSNGTASYYAWHEVYPRPSVLVTYISPGDSITVTISKVPGNVSAWRIMIVRNSGTILNLTINTRTNLASEATAEFIVERPSILPRNQLARLANFGTITFSDCNTNQGALASLTSALMVIMTSNASSSGTYLAQPGALEMAANSFSVQYSAAVTSVGEFPISPLVLVLALISSFFGVTRRISKDKDAKR
jgi:archaellum component FlaF (FlaF/FlaG flagellin family)